MSGYDNTNKGILSRNDRREKDSHPEFKGSINVEGREYWLSGWVKEKKDGSGKFFSLSVKAKDAQTEQKFRESVAKTFGGSAASLDDSIPFAAEVR